MVEIILGVLVARYARMSGRRSWGLTIGWVLVSLLTFSVLLAPGYLAFANGVLGRTEVSTVALLAYYLGMAWFTYRRCREGIDYHTRPIAQAHSPDLET